MSQQQQPSLEKIFSSALGAWFAKRPTNIKLRGTPEQISAINEAVAATRAFEADLLREGATIESVVEKLEKKNVAASKFEKLLNVKWPL